MTHDPIFSVVVVAHDRREYLLEALKSISQQTLPREFFEVIIVKNFVDREADDYAESNSFELVLTDVEPVGAKMSIGIEKSNGKYIAFLEDDDLFEESKLFRVNEEIRDKEIGFMHNSFELIDAQGHSLPSTTKGLDIEFRRGESFVRTCMRYGLKFNDIVLSSCMVVSKALITQHLKQLSQIRAAPDLFILFSFLASSYSGTHTKSKLSKYRLHESHSNRSGNEIDFIERNLEIRRNWVLDYTIMKRTFSKGEAHKLAEHLFHYNLLFTALLDSRRNPINKLKNIVHLAKTPELFRFYQSIELVLFAVLSTVSPSLSHRKYYEYRRIKYYSTFV